MLITSREINIAFRRGYDARVKEERAQAVTVVSRHPGVAEAILGAAVGEDIMAQIREAYEFYQLDSDKAMAAQIFMQQVGEILETES